MEDSLSMLRKCVINKKSIVINDEKVIFDHKYCWPTNTKTNYIVHGSGNNEGPPDYYTIESLVFFLKKQNLQHSRYVRDAVQAKIQVIQRPNRKDLLAFLNGEIATSQSIDKSYFVKNVSIEEIQQIPQPVKLNVYKKRHSNTKELDINPVAMVKKRRLYFAAESSINVETTDNSMSINEITQNEITPRSDVVMINTSNKENRRVDQNGVTTGGESVLDDKDDLLIMFESKPSIRINSDQTERATHTRRTILQSDNMDMATKAFETLEKIEKFERNKYRFKQEQHSDHINFMDNYNHKNPEIINHNDSVIEIEIEPPKNCETMRFTSVENNNNWIPPKKIITNTKDFNCMHSIKTPIIVISNSQLSLITIVNAVDILEKLTFIPKEEKVTSANTKRENEIKIQRKTNDGLLLSYRVIADPLKLDAQEWKDIIAIFVVGTAWQFKNWPIYNGSPINIFSKINAFHLKYDDTPTDVNIERWQVKTININRTKQHCNRMALTQFWTTLNK